MGGGWKAILGLAAFLAAAPFAEGHAEGWLEGTARSVGSGLGWRAANDGGDGVYESVKDAVVESVRSMGDGPESGTEEGRGGRKGRQDGWGRKGAPRRDDVPFVPGVRTLFADDFTASPPGTFPGKWTLSGPKAMRGNALATVAWDGRRYLRSRPVPAGEHHRRSVLYARLPPGTVLPPRFTVEFDALLGHSADVLSDGRRHADRYVLLLHRNLAHYPAADFTDPGEITVAGDEVRTANVTASLDRCDGGVHRVAVEVDGPSARVFLDGELLLEDPGAVPRPVHALGFALLPGNGNPTERLMVTNVRMAEGEGGVVPIASDGEAVRHGRAAR